MTSALMHKARLDPVTDDEMLRAKTAFVAAEAEKLVRQNMVDLLLEMNGDEAELLHAFYNAVTTTDLVEARERFRERINHEARVMAERGWTATEATRAAMAIQDARCE